ncbi:response regulator [Methylotuvimicrobium alcaliphilum]|uniref:Response regulator Input and output domains: CheY and HTH LuxR family n=1 Tax=Methylotuvimicrobium alcaliphilum (strain DSM 19304 / NCIMB 14124 / VKM B-2133 / 20Z) TaxID=1091494 RepID=G4T411_META2|nr:response regulator transcription factor [Methylotuvimicrobium alcaliphilum]CCE23746.1 putative response regulator; Input and output domains: CheY and HTH LuxR family [Methylotuvimicrobium alcaliphilum 20Z]
MISILLVDDHAIVREGYRALLSKQPCMRVVAEAGDGTQAYQLFKEYEPDLVITDISLPSSSGLELIAKIKQRRADARILVFSMHQNPAFAEQAVHAGALGYVSKSSEPEVLLRAIHDVYSGRHVLSPDIAQILALEKLGSERIALQTLKVREFEILRLLMEGQSHDDIARVLNISAKTVGNCHYLIKSKLGVASDIELTKLAIKFNVLDPLELSRIVE